MTESVRLQQAESIGYACPKRYNASRLLFDNLKNGRADAPAVVTDTGIITYEALAKDANRIGNTLLGRNLPPGARVIMFMDDEPAYPAAIMGAMKAGLVPILVNTLSTPDLLRFLIEDSSAEVAIVSRDFQDIFAPSIITDTPCQTLITTGPANEKWIDWNTVKAAPDTLDEAETSKDDMAFWMYSSGTTGRPKGVVHRHEDPLYTHYSYGRHILQLKPGDICYSIPKIFFAYGFGNSVTFPFAAGAASLLVTGRPEPARVFDQIAECRPTVLFALPTAYTSLIRHEGAAEADLSSVRLCISAAEVLSKEIADAWHERFGHHIVEGLGSTEMLHIYLSNDERKQKHGSAGRAVPGYAIRLKDTDGKTVSGDKEGVMEVAGISGARQYWNRPDKTEETMRGEWLYTGDRFRIDEEGYYFFLGRADDLIKVSGQWLWPHEIEMTLAEHPQVHECVVLAEELEDKRMTVVAYVVPAKGIDGDDKLTEELKAFVKQSLLPYKYPRRIHYRSELPKTGTGKIYRHRLRQEKPVG